MATLYELEHNVQLPEPRRSTRRVDMASFFSLLDQLASPQAHRQHATPTPVDAASVFRLLQDQLQTLHATAPTPDNRQFLERLMASLEEDINDPPTELRGAPQEFVDALDRVSRKALRAEDDCAICKLAYLDDEYPLVVELPCKGRHRFDLECVGPWLRSKGTCPMCREEMGGKKPAPAIDDEDEDDVDMMFA